jgi:hypothetical protein
MLAAGSLSRPVAGGRCVVEDRATASIRISNMIWSPRAYVIEIVSRLYRNCIYMRRFACIGRFKHRNCRADQVLKTTSVAGAVLEKVSCRLMHQTTVRRFFRRTFKTCRRGHNKETQGSVMLKLHVCAQKTPNVH